MILIITESLFSSCSPVTDMWLGWEGREGTRESRDRPGVGCVGDTVYLVGGASTRTLLDVVEKWDGTNWTRCAPLNIARSVRYLLRIDNC